MKDLKTGDRFMIDGNVVRVASIWQTKAGWTARLDRANGGDKNVSENYKIEETAYFRFNMPSLEYERIRFILKCSKNTILFREFWKSGMCTGSYDKTESKEKFKEFMKGSCKIDPITFTSVFKESNSNSTPSW